MRNDGGHSPGISPICRRWWQGIEDLEFPTLDLSVSKLGFHTREYTFGGSPRHSAGNMGLFDATSPPGEAQVSF
jgi:hypothetical protein